ncbi:hypothetical protein KY290_013410 [Solanum tuberosum]|uniref:Reverse transcriptase n=1 Tax=Solanum tuberosum TaxID=4113 RepID=A0ABQ7VLM5_SOLTU|nr:hypothetical protein KY285_012875 [Solanum tuberosum]KAH0769429.1 hypothetical protein KY290_013410 [Solanum tuberosum]
MYVIQTSIGSELAWVTRHPKSRLYVKGVASGRDNIQVDPKKTKMVKNCPRLLSASNIWSFFGLTGYYRRSIDGFSSIASPLRTLTQKKVKFLWLEAFEKNYKELRDRLMLARTLTLSEGSMVLWFIVML